MEYIFLRSSSLSGILSCSIGLGYELLWLKLKNKKKNFFIVFFCFSFFLFHKFIPYRNKQGNHTSKNECWRTRRASSRFFWGVSETEWWDDGLSAASDPFFGVKGGDEGGDDGIPAASAPFFGVQGGDEGFELVIFPENKLNKLRECLNKINLINNKNFNFC